MPKLQTIAAGAVIGLLVLTFTHGAAYLVGRSDERADHAVDAANNTIGATQANATGDEAVRQADTQLTLENNRLRTELENARAALNSFRRSEPAPGRVGPNALVDPAYAGAFVACLERMRNGETTEPGDCTAIDVHGAANDEPVPARAPS